MEWLLTIRRYILAGFLALPMLLISFLGFISLGLGNIGLFLLFLGHTIAVPIATALLNLSAQKLGKATSPTDERFFSMSERAKLIPSSSDVDHVGIVPSYWMAHITFFFSYLLTNAVKVYRLPQDVGVDTWRYENRKRKATALIITSVLFLIGLIGLRLGLTRVENWRSVVAVIPIGFLGWGWYELAATCGARPADIFGIVSLMINPGQKQEQPLLCVYSPKPV